MITATEYRDGAQESTVLVNNNAKSHKAYDKCNGVEDSIMDLAVWFSIGIVAGLLFAGLLRLLRGR